MFDIFKYIWNIRNYVMVFLLGLVIPIILYTVITWILTLLAMFFMWVLPEHWYLPFGGGNFLIERILIFIGIFVGIYAVLDYNKFVIKKNKYQIK